MEKGKRKKKVSWDKFRRIDRCVNEIDSIVKNTYNEAASWLGLEPGTFRWHVKTSICNIKKLINADRMHRKGSQRVILTSPD